MNKSNFEIFTAQQIDEFLATVKKNIEITGSFVKVLDDVKRYEYPGDLLDCFECKLNQVIHCEMICTSEFTADEEPIFPEEGSSVEGYVLTICNDFAGMKVICFRGFANSKMVLRELMNLYNADGV